MTSNSSSRAWLETTAGRLGIPCATRLLPRPIVAQLVGSSTRLALLIFAVASTGCLVIPVKEHEVTSGRKLETKETAGWRLGETKRAEVLQQLGAPYTEFQDLNVIAYQWVVVSAVMPWFVAGGYSAAGGVESLGQEHLLLVGFDAAERVAKFEVVHHNFGRLHTQAKRWTASMAASGARITGSGRRSTANSEDTVLLYVYRPGGLSERVLRKPKCETLISLGFLRIRIWLG